MTAQMGALAKALAVAQAEMSNAAFNRTNPHFKSKYADLAGIRDTVTPALAKHGLAVIQTVEAGEPTPVLVTRLIHADGGEIVGRYPLPTNYGEPQKFGSALTYARRYSLAALCNIASEEDDDGNEASAKPANDAGRKAAPPPPADQKPLNPREELIAWAQTVIEGLPKLNTLAKFDAWEGRSLDKLDRLEQAARDTWQIVKGKMTAHRKALEAPAEAA